MHEYTILPPARINMSRGINCPALCEKKLDSVSEKRSKLFPGHRGILIRVGGSNV